MSKGNWITVVLSVVLSVSASLAVNVALDRQREPILRDVVRVKRVEILDADGLIRASFGLGSGGASPMLALNRTDGLPAMEMGVDNNGFGGLSFSSDRWNEGAVMVGYLGTGGDVSAGPVQDRIEAHKWGRWGLQVRGAGFDFSGVGFSSDGRWFAPRPESPAKPFHPHLVK